ncbi:MAG: Nif11-like leader peptide family natural product precursor [Fuerstiella sp.]
MSVENLSNFMAAIGSSDDLAQQAVVAIDGTADPSAFVALGQANGYEFTVDEVVSNFDSTGSDEGAGELSEADLQNVAGGGFRRQAVGTAMLSRMGRMNNVPDWASQTCAAARMTPNFSLRNR